MQRHKISVNIFLKHIKWTYLNKIVYGGLCDGLFPRLSTCPKNKVAIAIEHIHPTLTYSS